MAVKDGTVVVIKLATTLVNGLVNNNIDLSVDEIDVTTKDSVGNKEYIAGEFSGTLGMDGKLDEADANTFSELLTTMKTKAAVAFIYGDVAAGSQVHSGSCIITSLSQAGPQNGARTFACGMRITGAVTEGTVAA